jgi:hypothetical protein
MTALHLYHVLEGLDKVPAFDYEQYQGLWDG